MEVVYVFHKVNHDSICDGKRRPRDNPLWPEVGILAQRAKNRPNRIGVSICELIGREEISLKVRGLDAIDGTPGTGHQAVVQRIGPFDFDSRTALDEGVNGRLFLEHKCQASGVGFAKFLPQLIEWKLLD